MRVPTASRSHEGPTTARAKSVVLNVTRGLTGRLTGGLLATLIAAGTTTSLPTASAQTLTLGPAASMPTGERFALSRAITAMELAAKSLEPGETNPAPGADGASRRLRYRYRTFVLAVLTKARELADRGEAHAVAGLTLANGAEAFDMLVAKRAAAEPAARQAFEAAVLALPTRAADLSADASMLDATLAARLAPIGVFEIDRGGAPGPGWIPTTPAVNARFTARRDEAPAPPPKAPAADAPPAAPTPAPPRPGIPDALAASIERLENSTVPIEAAGRFAVKIECVRLGRRAFEQLPTWIPPARQAHFRALAQAELERACASLDADYDAEQLSSIGLTVALIAHISERRELPTRISRDLRELALQLVGGDRPSKKGAAFQNERAALLTVLKALETTADASSSARRSIEENLVREVRPAYRLLARDREEAAEHAMAAAIQYAKRGVGGGGGGGAGGGAPADPALLAAMNAYRTVSTDLIALEHLSAWLAAPARTSDAPTAPGGAPATPPITPRVGDDPVRKRAATRVLKLGQSMAKRDQRDAAIAACRTAALASPPNASEPEAAARAARLDPDAAKAWNRASADQIADVLDEMQSIRSELARSFGDHDADITDTKDLAPLVTSLEVGRALVTAIQAVARVQTSASAIPSKDAASPATSSAPPITGTNGIAEWPGWELAAAPIRAMLEGAPDLLSRASEAFVSRDDEKARALLDEFTRDYAFVTLLDRLNEQARAADLAAAPGYMEFFTAPMPIDGPLTRAALGAPWLADQRADLARICWLAAEYDATRAEAENATDRRREDLQKQADELRQFINMTAQDVSGFVTAQSPQAKGWCPQMPPPER